MKKQEIRLNEEQLNEIISESITKYLLKEYGEGGYGNNQANNYPNNQLLASFIQESEMLRRSIGNFQASVQQLGRINQELQQTQVQLNQYGRNLGQFGNQINMFAERFQRYCNNLLQKIQGAGQTQMAQQPVQ